MSQSENENNLISNQNIEKSNNDNNIDSNVSNRSVPSDSLIKQNLVNQNFGKEFNLESDKNKSLEENINISDSIEKKESPDINESDKIEEEKEKENTSKEENIEDEIKEDNLPPYIEDNIKEDNLPPNLDSNENKEEDILKNKENLENEEKEKMSEEIIEEKEPEEVKEEEKSEEVVEEEKSDEIVEEEKSEEEKSEEIEEEEKSEEVLEEKKSEEFVEEKESEEVVEEKESEEVVEEKESEENKKSENIESLSNKSESYKSNQMKIEEIEKEEISEDKMEENIDNTLKEEKIEILPERKFDLSSYIQVISNIGNCCNDEFFLPPNYDFETKTPYPLNLNDEIKNKIHLFLNGESHGLIVNNEGKLFTYGNNDTGCLGRNTENNNEKLPNLVDLFYERRRLQINMISAGNCHSLVGDNKRGRLFMAGNFRNGEGFITDHIKKFTEVEFEPSKKMTFIGSGSNFSIVKLKNSIYSFGCNNFGQLGIGLEKNKTINKNQDSVLKLKNIKIFNKKKVSNIFPIYCGCFVLTKKDEIFCWGNNSSCQLGFESQEKRTEEFAPICQDVPISLKQIVNLPFEVSSIIDIKGGMSHTIFLLNSGSIYGIGSNENGQLGLKEKEVKNITLIPIPTKIKEIHCNRYSTYVIDEKGELYSFGFGSYYVLGTKEEKDINEPFKIPMEFFLDNQLPRTLSMGCNHISFVSGENYTSLNPNTYPKTKSKTILKKKLNK